VFEFLDLDPNRAAADFRSVEQHVVGNGMRLDRTSEIQLDERWRQALTPGDLEAFDRIAGAMNRRYGRAFYIDLVARLKSEIPDFCLTLDVMAGFPGEREEHFQNTVRLLEEVRPLKCHVFPYSAREGTRAYRFEEETEDQIKHERVEFLTALSDRLGAQERRRFLGRSLPVQVEVQPKSEGMLAGLSSNYLKVYFEGPAVWTGSRQNVELLSLQGDVFLGKAV
jgi:threonylcarbamoyladenosine tRNA methylthiotransferase MtaB